MIIPEHNGVPSMKTGLTVPSQPSMISSSPRFDPTVQAKAILAAASAAPAKSASEPDRLATSGAQALSAALHDQPEIRPEVVERGRALAADPNYPSAEILLDISRRILASPDPADDTNV